MTRNLAASPNTHPFQIVAGGIDDSSGSMEDAGRSFLRKGYWRDAVRSQLTAIAHLPPNWDGYGARPVASDTILFALQVLAEVWMADLPVPDISPMSNEGIMIEWISGEVEFTLEIEGPYTINFLFERFEDEAVEEGSVSRNLAAIDPYLKQLVDPAGPRVAA